MAGLSGFGIDKKEIIYKDWLHWFVQINDYEQLWKAQPTYIISQIVYIFAGILTLIHAFRKGGRWPWFWLGTILHGLITDNVWHFILPEMDNFWHSQTPIIFLGGRLPLHIILLYPVFMYHAAYAVSKLNLPAWSEPFAVGLTTVLVDIPYDIVAVKFLHWTWHDTDPNIFDRHYWVPWNSYYFHAAFAASFVFWFHLFRKLSAPKIEKWQSAGFVQEFKSFLLSSILGMPGGILLFVFIYHPLHDVYGIHSEVTFFALFAVFAVLTWSGVLTARKALVDRLTAIDYALISQLVLHFVLYWAFTVWGHPEHEISIGLHEPVGPCNEKASLQTPFGMTLYKRKYLCVNDYDEDYFNFSCLPGGKKPANGSIWYTACGTPFRNRAEYITVLSTILLVAFGIFYSLYFKTQPIAEQNTKHSKQNIGKKSKTH